MGDATAWNATNSSVLALPDFLGNTSIYADFLLCWMCLFISSSWTFLAFLKKVNRIICLKLQSFPYRKKEETYTCSLKVSSLGLYCSIKGKKQRSDRYGPCCWTANLKSDEMQQEAAIHCMTWWKGTWCQLAQWCCAEHGDNNKRGWAAPKLTEAKDNFSVVSQTSFTKLG